MHPSIFAVIIIMMLSPAAFGTIYKCQQPNGQTVFADTSCGSNAQTVEAHAIHIGGRLDTGTQVKTWQPPHTTRNITPKKTACPTGYINSTRLRTLRVKQQVRAGMSQKQVRYILGEPDHHDGPWWVYEHDSQETGRYRIRGGCLDRWR